MDPDAKTAEYFGHPTEPVDTRCKLLNHLDLRLLPLQSSQRTELLHLLAEHQADDGQQVETRAAIHLLLNTARTMAEQAARYERRAASLAGTIKPLEGDHYTKGQFAQQVTASVLMADWYRGVEVLAKKAATDMERDS